MKWSAWCLGPIGLILSLASSATGDDRPSSGMSRALIIAGLPGDPAHDALFRTTVQAWKDWLVGPLGFPSAEVRVLSGPTNGPRFGDAPATKESISREVEALGKRCSAEDRVWVFVLGHANLDDGHAFLHLPGPDFRDDAFAGLFRGLAAKEQVFWITTAASGAFLAPLSAPGRIVIAATERSGEVNETEFPHALADLCRGPVDRFDVDQDGKVSVFEVVLATVEAIEARFLRDKRAPTENAQLDDNGDGVGTEPKPNRKPTDLDGALASKTFLPVDLSKIPIKPPARSAHGTDRVVPPPR